MRPDLGPLLGGLWHSLQRLPKGPGRGLIVLLIVKCLPHTEIRQRAVRLNGERLLVLSHGIVILALFGQLFTAGDGRARAQRRAAFQNHVVRIDFDATGLRPAKGLYREIRLRAYDLNRFQLGIAFRLDAKLHRHAECLERLLDLSHHTKPFGSSIDDIFHREFRHAGGVEPLREKRLQVRSGLLRRRSCLRMGDGHLLKVVNSRVLPCIVRVEVVQQRLERHVAHLRPDHVEDHRALVHHHGAIVGRIWRQPMRLGYGRSVFIHQRADGEFVHNP